MWLTQKSVRSFHPANALQIVLRWRREDNCWIKLLFLFSLHTKSILVASYNYGWTPDVTDYFTDILAKFLDLDRVRTLAVYEGSESSQNMKRIFTFMFRRWTEVLQVWNWNTWGWVINYIIFIFGWTIPLSKVLPKVPLLVNERGVVRSHKLYLKRHILCPKYKITSCQLPIDR